MNKPSLNELIQSIVDAVEKYAHAHLIPHPYWGSAYRTPDEWAKRATYRLQCVNPNADQLIGAMVGQYVDLAYLLSSQPKRLSDDEAFCEFWAAFLPLTELYHCGGDFMRDHNRKYFPIVDAIRNEGVLPAYELDNLSDLYANFTPHDIVFTYAHMFEKRPSTIPEAAQVLWAVTFPHDDGELD